MEFIYLVVNLEQPVFDLINKHREDHRVCPGVLVPQADQTPSMRGNFVELAENTFFNKTYTFLDFLPYSKGREKIEMHQTPEQRGVGNKQELWL